MFRAIGINYFPISIFPGNIIVLLATLLSSIYAGSCDISNEGSSVKNTKLQPYHSNKFPLRDLIFKCLYCSPREQYKPYKINSKYVINATGPWVDELRLLNKSKQGHGLHLTKGVHLVFPFEKFPVKQSVYFDVPDGRMIFAIPRGKITYVGTTDTNYTENKDEVYTLFAEKRDPEKCSNSLIFQKQSKKGYLIFAQD